MTDLAPFFQDRCWMFVLLARQASVGVILRRGPTDWWHITRWDTQRDAFEPGQWFRGRLYPGKCDLSPDGRLLVYFAGKFRPYEQERGYGQTWIAVSRPPYLTALALWPVGDTWGGQGVFYDDRTLLIGAMLPNHPNHPPGSLKVLKYFELKRTDPLHDVAPCWQSGWQKRNKELRKMSGDLTLAREITQFAAFPSRSHTPYALYRSGEEPVALFQAQWADWDQRGRLVATVGGRVLAGALTKRNKLVWRQLAALNEEQPGRMEAPGWAQHW